MSLKKEHKKAFSELFSAIYKNDMAATELSFMLLEVAHTWDDLVDRDKLVPNYKIDRAFLYSLQGIPMHKYWSAAMSVTLNSVYLKWHAANQIEQDEASTDNDLAKAWMLRASLYDLFEMLCLQLHGIEWAKQHSVLIRLFYGETLQDYLAEIKQCRTQ